MKYKMPFRKLSRGSEDSGDDVQDQLILTPEITEFIFNLLDLEGGKNCRLVCKCWNIEICRSWRKNVAGKCVYFKDFLTLSTLLEKGLKLGLPAPFQCLAVRVKTEYIPKFEHILHRIPPMCITQLTLTETGESFSFKSSTTTEKEAQEHEMWLLKHCAASLSHLTVQSVRSKKNLSLEAETHDLCLPQLKSVYLRVGCDIHENDYVIPTVMDAAPNLWKLDIEGDRNLAPLLLRMNMSTIQKLTIKWGKAHGDILDALKSLEMKQLKFLKLYPTTDIDFFKFGYDFVDVITSVSETLECLDLAEIEINVFEYEAFDTLFPACPNLIELRLWNFKVGSNFLRRLPSLKCLQALEARSDLGRDFEGLVPCETVDTLRVHHYGTDVEKYISVPLYPLSLDVFEGIMQQFPNVKTRYLLSKFVPLYCEMARASDGESLLGIAKLEIEPDLMGVNGSKVLSSLLPLPDLKCLELRDFFDWKMKNTVFSPTLEELRFYWRDSINPEVFAKKVSHLKRVVVLNCCHKYYAKPAGEFLKLLPTARCGCKEPLDDYFANLSKLFFF